MDKNVVRIALRSHNIFVKVIGAMLLAAGVFAILNAPSGEKIKIEIMHYMRALIVTATGFGVLTAALDMEINLRDKKTRECFYIFFIKFTTKWKPMRPYSFIFIKKVHLEGFKLFLKEKPQKPGMEVLGADKVEKLEPLAEQISLAFSIPIRYDV